MNPEIRCPLFTEPTKPDAPLNIVWVNSFDEEKSKLFAESIYKASRENKDQPIIVMIDSYGGSVYGIFHMLSALDSVPNPIVTVVEGKAMSAGAILFSHGDHRFVIKHSRVMLHEMQAGAWGDIKDIRTTAKELERLNDYIMELTARNCGKDPVEFKKLFAGESRELYLSAQQAVDFGIADYIGTPVVSKQSFFMVGNSEE